MIKFWVTWKYKLLVGVAILAALAIAIYAAHTIGYNKGKNISQVEISKYEGKVNKLQGELKTAQANVTTKIVTQYIKDIAYIDRVEYKNRDIIRTVVAPRADGATVTKGFIYAHNQLALGLPIINFDLARDATPSQTPDNEVLDVVAQNYTITNKTATQLIALQKWINDTYEASKKVSNERNK